MEARIKILSDNRQASHNYHLSDRIEAGIVLAGTEVKAAKTGKIQLKDAYAEVRGNEAWLFNAHISQYSHGNRENHEPVRARKLLLHRDEIGNCSKDAGEGSHRDPHQDVSEGRLDQMRVGGWHEARSSTTSAKPSACAKPITEARAAIGAEEPTNREETNGTETERQMPFATLKPTPMHCGRQRARSRSLPLAELAGDRSRDEWLGG